MADKVVRFLEQSQQRLLKESTFFLTDEEKTEIKSEPSKYILNHQEYAKMYTTPKIVLFASTCGLLSARRNS